MGNSAGRAAGNAKYPVKQGELNVTVYVPLSTEKKKRMIHNSLLIPIVDFNE